MNGFGKVGLELIKQTWDKPNYQYIAVSDSSGIATKYSGFTYNDFVRLISLKERGGKVSEYSEGRTAISEDMEDVLGNKPDVLVDVSDKQTYKLLMSALDKKIHIVGSNKPPYADVSSEDFEKMFLDAKRNGCVIDNRTVVSANLGVLVRAKEFANTARGISYLRGCLSGTMGYISWRINQDVPFSQALSEAVSKGYTESDFRKDLDGLDSARKAVIIGRTSGYPLELKDVEVEKILPPELERAGVKEASGMLPMVDEGMKSRVEVAKRKGCTLRYVGELDFDRGIFKIGFSEIPLDDPQASVKGSWNKVTMHPRYWMGEPLTVEGPGAGINVTTQGLMAGLYDIASMSNSSK